VRGFFNRWWWVFLLAAVSLGLARLRFDVDILNLLPPDEPTVQGLKLYQRHFTNARELVVTLRAPDPERAERLAKELTARFRAQSNLVAAASWQPPWTEHPEQMAELLACLWINQPPEVFGALTNRLAPEQLRPVLEQTKELLTTSMSPMDVARRSFDPYDLLNVPSLNQFSGFSMEQGQKMFASSGGNFHLVMVTSAVDLSGYRECASWLKSIRRTVAEAQAAEPEAWKGAVVHFTGRPVFVVEIASSMQHDMGGSVVGTSVIIGLLFWLTHRRWLPMLWLLTLLGMVLVGTLGVGSLILGPISVVSMGFAAVLLGLAVDYAVVHYQEALAHPQLSVPEIRRAIAPSILWAAITTMSAFMVLNLGGLPGLAQLGTLVAVGVGLAAWVMVMIYLPPLFPGRRTPPAGQASARWWNYFIPPAEKISEGGGLPTPWPARALALSALVFLGAGLMVAVHIPKLDRSGDALRPKRGEAEAALDEITAEMGMPPETLWLVVSGQDEARVYERLHAAEQLLNAAVSNRLVGNCLIPSALWPRGEYQAANRQTAAWLAGQEEPLRRAAAAEGFTSNALVLTDELLKTWRRASVSSDVVWPTNQASQWLLKRFVARSSEEWLVMGVVYPPTNDVPAAALAELSRQLAQHQAFLSGWTLLGSTTLRRVQGRLWQLVLPMVGLVMLSLWLAFRRWREILLGVTVLLLSGLVLLATMSISGWSWNLLNLMGLPLILGTGVDYSLFMQLALRRHGGDVGLVRRSIGRALLLCGGTAIAGFGSLACSSNPGMASLGKVCTVGIGANMLISVFLLPAWWTALQLRQKGITPGACPKPSEAPSVFYCASLWRAGLVVVRVLPAGLLKLVCVLTSELHYRVRPARREVVVQNLLPAFGGVRHAAEDAAHRLYRNFARKLVDLWRIEGGNPVREWLTNPPELEVIRKAARSGRGVLFLTMHLGNWEHGGLLLNQIGIRLTVLSQAEPEDGLTELRNEMRARCGVGSLIVGQDDFAFVEAIKQLQNGAMLGVAMDRPSTRNAAEVLLFDKPFRATSAAAELARASGCALIGVTIVRRPAGYAVKVLPEFVYDRRALGNREARRELTQQILRAFEPEIREDIDQWYQFVSVWRKTS
jgi:predicted RND superfamily exporter protein/lauroyl/myristoyl acyltransferase